MSDQDSDAAGATASAEDSFDAGAFKALDTANMIVNHPVTGMPTKWVITWAGPAHPQTRAVADRQQRRQLIAGRAQQEALANGRAWKPPALDPDELRDQTVGDIVDRIVTWTPVRLDGQVVEHSRAKAFELLRDPAYGRLFQQCVEFLAADTSFTRSSGGS